MKTLIACCGLDCEKCQARKATVNNDDELRKKIAEEWSQLNGVLITREMINCLGCRVDGLRTPFCEKLCPIRQCVIKKNLKTCGDCSVLESCEKIQMIISNNKEAFERLKMKDGD